MKLIVTLISLLPIVMLLGCGTPSAWKQPIQHYCNFEIPVSQILVASVGSTLVRMNRQSDLPNAYGGKDIYHGKINRGFVEVKLVQIAEKELTLSVSDINYQSTETTMDRYVNAPSVNITQQVQVTNSGEEGTIIKLNTNDEQEYVIGGVKIKFKEVRPSSVVYEISDLMPIQAIK